MRSLLGWLIWAGVITIALGLGNFALISEGELGSDYKRMESTVGQGSWPELVFTAGTQTYKIQQWVPLPWWSPGDIVGLWVNEDGQRVVPEFGPLHPLLLMLYGFVLTMGAAAGMAFSKSEFEQYIAKSPEWPIELHVDRGRAWTGTWLAIGLVGWVIYDWYDTRQFDWAADLTRLLFGFILGIAATHWLTGKITVTPDEIRDESWVSKKKHPLRNVATAAVEIVRGNGPKKPLIGSKLVLRNAEGKEVYAFPDLLEPSEKFWDLRDYLLKRFSD